jgi:hypothetical protein
LRDELRSKKLGGRLLDFILIVPHEQVVVPPTVIARGLGRQISTFVILVSRLSASA